MNRVVAEALVLVNWRGVFYERYALDRHVTALEGDNGAGKTTVMIAAYVVLLPDMSRLRFTNLGETGATGGDKGIWGRLGEPGRPAYAAIEFRLPRGERVLAGVHLERKGEPTVEPTPFLVTGLRDDVRLQDLLLLAQGEIELVPELSELRDTAARLGGRLQVFAAAKDYFAALFEHGITPMRLGTDEERNKLNEMLKTSMTGGMSKGLLQELRSFLLKEEGGLAETLNRMKANLDACRRTRLEVVEAQRLEKEIGSVYQAGEEMFAAAVAATRQRADEMSKRVAEKEAAAALAAELAEAAEVALRASEEALLEAEVAKASATGEVEASKTWEERVRAALQWATELDVRERTLANAASQRLAAEGERAAAERALCRAAQQVAEASDARERAAEGLADVQKGLEELHRRTDAHRRVTERLHTARRELEDADFEASAAEELADQTEQHLADTDRERRELTRQIADASAHRGEHAEALAALMAIVEHAVDPAGASGVAEDALASVRAWRDSARQRAALTDQLRRTEAESARQRAAEERARELGVAWAPGSGRPAVTNALAEAERAHADAEALSRAAEAAGAEADRQLSDAKKQIQSLDERAVAWRDLDAKARRLTDVLGTPVSSREALDSARAALHERLDTQRAESARLSARRDELLADARQLRHAGGSFPDALLALRDTLTADLLASHFDDVGLDDAAELEARLGPLAQALVVPNVEQAARALAGRPDALPTVWLVAEDAALTLAPDATVGSASTRDVLVREREALRVTRLPDRPTLGRTAREQRATALEREAGALDSTLEQNRAAERQTRGLLAEADGLLGGAATWSLGDPAAALDEARRLADEANRARHEAQRDAVASRHRAQALAPRMGALRELLPDAALLDAPELAETLERLRTELRASDEAIAHLARIGDAPLVLERHREALRRAPLSDDAVSEEHARLAALNTRRDRLAAGLEALRYVASNAAALEWTDAAPQLMARQGLVPALQDQLEAAKRALGTAQSAEAAAKAASTAAQSAYNQRDAQHATARSERDEAARRVAECGVALPTPALLVQAEARATQARRALMDAETRWGQLQKDVGRRQAEAEAARNGADGARAAVEDERKQARPAVEGWDRLKPQLEARGLMAAALSERFQKAFGDQGSVNVWQTARDNKARLVERLRSARGGPDILGEVQRWLEATDQTTGEGYLHGWVIVRSWLSARLPAQIAEVDEPLEALQRFRDHLGGLVERLERQERDLRGASEDVARGIDVQIRKAHVRVRRLNEHLDGVRFGNIRGIRVKMLRVERMEQVLRALRSGEAQELLFQAGLPVEQALDEIFRRYGGGRTGGQRLLDYREYLQLQVEVRRGGSLDWETANPTRLSTGEAIGVGAALMMVVLTEWERDANLLRGRRASGSVRFLFLDEANRLDQANLGTVFDLCRNLDLQLLVAAPEVARAEGCTVFRLVRARGENGREQVLVSGRRVVAEA